MIQLGQWNIAKSTLKGILDFLPYPFLISERKENKIHNTFTNRKFQEEIGYTPDDIPTIDEWFEKAYPESYYRKEIITAWTKLFDEALAANEDSIYMKAFIQTKSYGKRWYEVKSSIQGDVQLVAFVNIHQEISKEEELMRLNENKNRTLAILSHDLRGPLTNLHALAQLALNSTLTQEEFVSTVKSVQEKSFQALEFLDTTLHWTRSNFDNIQTNTAEVNLHDLIQGVLKIYENSYKTKHINIVLDLQPHPPVKTDAEIITIAFRNLLSNAIKFTPDSGTITLSVHNLANQTAITVADTGVGMAAETIERIFSDHYSSQNGTRQEKGLGIGLRLCRELLKKINSSIQMESEPNRGARVRILLTSL